MNNEALENKLKEAEGLSSIGLINSGPFLTAWQADGSIQEGIASLRQALLIYQQDDIRSAFPEESKKGEAEALFRLHYPYFEKGQHEQALLYLQQALSLYQSLQALSAEANTLENIGLVYSSMGQYNQAADYINRAISLYRTFDPTGECDSLNNLGNVCIQAARLKEAAWSYQQSIELAQQIGNAEKQISPSTNLAIVCLIQQNYPRAVECYENAIALSQTIGRFSQQAGLLKQLGGVHHRYNQTQLGDECLRRAREIERVSKDSVINPVPGDSSKSYISVSI